MNLQTKISDIPALILCGGLGTRIRRLYPGLPKSLVPINNTPFLSYLLDRLDMYGIRKVVLCTGFKKEQIYSYYKEKYKNMEINYSAEEVPLGTGGAIINALDLVFSEEILVLNGDSYCAVDLNEFVIWHYLSSFETSIVLCKNEDAKRFGACTIDERGMITSFCEKENDNAAHINAGIYLLRSDRVRSLNQQKRIVSLENDLFPFLVQEKKLSGFITNAAFIDIGTEESLACANKFFDNFSKTPL